MIAGAGLDNLPGPIDVRHPLLEIPQCVVMPHSGAVSREARIAAGCAAVDNVLAGAFYSLSAEEAPNGQWLPSVGAFVYQTDETASRRAALASSWSDTVARDRAEAAPQTDAF